MPLSSAFLKLIVQLPPNLQPLVGLSLIANANPTILRIPQQEHAFAAKQITVS